MEDNFRKAWTKAAACVDENDCASLEKLLEEDPAIALASADEKGRSLLHLAAAQGKIEAMETLFLNGQPWNALDGSGKTAGEYALQAGQTKTYLRLLQEGVRAELILAAVEAANASGDSGEARK